MLTHFLSRKRFNFTTSIFTNHFVPFFGSVISITNIFCGNHSQSLMRNFLDEWLYVIHLLNLKELGTDFFLIIANYFLYEHKSSYSNCSRKFWFLFSKWNFTMFQCPLKVCQVWCGFRVFDCDQFDWPVWLNF